MSIALSLVEQLCRIAAEKHAVRITEVEVHCGVLRQVMPEALELAFSAVTEETVAAGATLKIIEEGLVARCRACGMEFATGIDDYSCPGCQQADVAFVAGHDIVLTAVVCETADR